MRPTISYELHDASYFINPDDWDEEFYVSLVVAQTQLTDSEISLEERIYRGH
jgi:hypothetical protein